MSADFKPVRDRKKTAKGTVLFSFMLDPEVLVAVEAEAKREFRTVTQQARMIITQWAGREQKR